MYGTEARRNQEWARIKSAPNRRFFCGNASRLARDPSAREIMGRIRAEARSFGARVIERADLVWIVW